MLDKGRLEKMQQGMESQEFKPVVWIIGNTVLMDGVATSLDEWKTISLVRLKFLNANIQVNLQANKPNLIIFELDAPGSYKLLDLLKAQPGIQLLGIDRNCNQVIVLNSLQRKTRTMMDLYQIVREIAQSGE